ncbi:hypothetical protein GCM10009789_37990 [Kribbella sancticallisti]|uniref:Uncharacterized protein n=1 Tax=Kribbella sancticallisti TaxID=460087 RepID=A0ABN2DPU4_9ACTN
MPVGRARTGIRRLVTARPPADTLAWRPTIRKLCDVTSSDRAALRRTVTHVLAGLVAAALVVFGPQCVEVAVPAIGASAVSTAPASFAIVEADAPDAGMHAGWHRSDGDRSAGDLLSACLALLLVVLLGAAALPRRRLLPAPLSTAGASIAPIRRHGIWRPCRTPAALGIARI